MSKYFKRKSNRKLIFTEELMEQIRTDIENGKSKRQIAKELNTNEATLRKSLKLGTIPELLGRFKSVSVEKWKRSM